MSFLPSAFKVMANIAVNTDPPPKNRRSAGYLER